MSNLYFAVQHNTHSLNEVQRQRLRPVARAAER